MDTFTTFDAEGQDPGDTLDLSGEPNLILFSKNISVPDVTGPLHETEKQPENLQLDTSDDDELPQANNVVEEDSLIEESKDLINYQEGNNFDTDIGCLAPLPINPKYREFVVQ